eukprot:UN10272
MIWKQNFAKTKRNLGKILTSSQEFFEFDLDHNGSVDKYEFLVGMLLKLDIVDMERIDEIMFIFHATDRDGNGVVDRRELKQKIAEDYMKLRWGQNAWKEIDREWKSIKIAQGQITNDKKKLKTKQQELNLKIKKFEKDKKEWHINRQKCKVIMIRKRNPFHYPVQLLVFKTTTMKKKIYDSYYLYNFCLHKF